MRRALKWAGILLLVLILLPVVVVGGVLVFANTSPGQAMIARLAGQYVPGLTIEGLHGGLPFGPRIDRITMADARGTYLTVEDAVLDVDLGALLRREVRIRRLYAGRLDFERLPESTAPAPEPQPSEGGSLIPSLPQLPVGLALEALEVKRLEIGQAVAGMPAALNLQAGGRLGDDGAFLGVKARRLDMPGALDADVALAPGQQVKLNVSYDEPAGGMVAGLLGLPPAPGSARITLDGPAEGAALTLRAAIGDALKAQADGTLALPATGGLGLVAKGNVQAPGLLPAPVTGGDFAVDLRPEGSGLRLNSFLVSAAPGRVEGSGYVGDNSDLTLKAALGNSEALGSLLPQGLGWNGIELNAHVTGSTSAPAIEAQGVVRQPRIPQAPPTLVGDAIRMDLKGDGERIEHLTVAGAGLNLEASGRYRDALDLTVKARMGDAKALGELLPAGIGWGALELDGTVTGTQQDPAVDAKLVMRDPRLPEPAPGLLGKEPVLTLRGDLKRIEHLELTGAGLSATASGSYQDPLDLTAQIRLANAEATGQPVRGRMQADLHVGGTLAAPTVQAKVNSPELIAQGHKLENLQLDADLARLSPPTGSAKLSGRLDGQPLSLDAASELNEQVLRIERLAAVLGPLRLDGGGNFDIAKLLFDGQVKLEARDLTPLSGIAGIPLAGGLNLEARGVPDARGVQTVKADLRLNRLTAAGTPVDGTVKAEGALDALNLQAQIAALDARLNTRARIDAVSADRTVNLAALDVTRGQMGIRLTAPATVTLRQDGGIRIGDMALAARPGGTLRLGGQWGPQQADLRATIANLPVAMANLFVPDPRLAGTVNGDVRVTGATAAPNIDGEIRATGLRADAPYATGLPPANLTVNAKMRGQAIEAVANLVAGSAVRATLEARLPQGAAANAPVQASLRGNANLGTLAGPLLAAGANRATGQLTIDARAAGTVSAPQLSGGATLSNGSFRNLEYGAALRNIAARITAQGDRIVLESLTASGTRGTLSAQGEARPFAPGQPLRIALTSQGLQPVTSDLFTGLFNTDLLLDGGLASGLRASGRIEIPEATLGIPTGLPGSVADLGDVREVGRGAPVPRRARAASATPAAASQPDPQAAPIALDINVVIPGRFYVRGRGLDAEMEGNLKVGGTASAPNITGSLNMVRGTFTLIDRRLSFSRGNLAFSGGVMPDLDFLATTTVQSTTINVAISGKPTAPKVEFTSSPELPQDEVLARLLFARPTSQLSPFQIAQIAQALAGATGALGSDSDGGFFGRIAKRLGLDRLGVDSTSSGELGVKAGGYVADGVYVNVDPGATTGQPRVGVEVELTPRLKLKSTTGTDGQSAGLSYEYEY
ncbi:translocation/assembly module TamB domain-containing protein [Roseomonas mucosa]|uniref:translocation/assembly module TamB domain-containing protein n=1 Tax=Roseomonas mucosa TaxID=207340 RepID=UPI0030CC0702